jgi:hypothetical protein
VVEFLDFKSAPPQKKSRSKLPLLLSKVNLEEGTRLTVKDYSLSMNSKAQSGLLQMAKSYE